MTTDTPHPRSAPNAVGAPTAGAVDGADAPNTRRALAIAAAASTVAAAGLVAFAHEVDAAPVAVAGVIVVAAADTAGVTGDGRPGVGFSVATSTGLQFGMAPVAVDWSAPPSVVNQLLKAKVKQACAGQGLILGPNDLIRISGAVV